MERSGTRASALFWRSIVTTLAVLLVPMSGPVLAGLRTTPSWTFEGEVAEGSLGNGGTAFGDFNGDGFIDAAFAAPRFTGSLFRQGKVYVFVGSAQGLSTAPGWTALGDQAESRFAHGQLAGGDFNGDGFTDLAVGAAAYTSLFTDAGSAFLWYGGPAGPGNPSGLGAEGTPSNADWTYAGTMQEEALGIWVSSAGDVNGDQKDDLMVGANNYSSRLAETGEGRALLFHGSAAGLGAAPDWTAESNQMSARMGNSFHTAHDINDDGYDDVIVKAACYEVPADRDKCTGRVFVWMGSATGLGANGTPANADWYADGDGSAGFGYWVSTADVNGDGFSDVMAGAPAESPGGVSEAGRAHIWFGGPSGAGNPSGLGPVGTPTNSDWRAEGNQSLGRLGFLIEPAGDVNADGYGDVLVTTWYWDVDGMEDAGIGLVWLGGPGGPGAMGTPTNADWVVKGRAPFQAYGGNGHNIRDVNGDGFTDVFVAAPGETVGGMENAGVIYVYYGACGAADGDGDGLAPAGSAGCDPGDVTDCNDADGGVWTRPGEARSIQFGGDKTTLSWSGADPGGTPTAVVYDTLRSPTPASFASPTCVESNDGADTSAIDATTPAGGGAFHYLVRAENACPGVEGQGSLGTDSEGVERSGGACP